MTKERLDAPTHRLVVHLITWETLMLTVRNSGTIESPHRLWVEEPGCSRVYIMLDKVTHYEVG